MDPNIPLNNIVQEANWAWFLSFKTIENLSHYICKLMYREYKKVCSFFFFLKGEGRLSQFQSFNQILHHDLASTGFVW